MGTTVISAGSAHTYCLTHDAASLTLKVYLDGELEGSAACGTAAFSTLPRRFVLGCGTAPFTAHQGPDDWSIGRTLFYTRALSDAEAAGAHRVFQQTYTDLP